jgi:hypothetical protein
MRGAFHDFDWAVRRIVDRQHVGTSDCRIVRLLAERIDASGLRWSKQERKRLYRYGLANHAENRKHYYFIMRGGF